MNHASDAGTCEAATQTCSDGGNPASSSASDASAQRGLGEVLPPAAPTVRDAVDASDDLAELAAVVSDIERTLRRIRVWVAELTDSVDRVASRAEGAEYALKKASGFAIDLEEMGFSRGRRRDE